MEKIKAILKSILKGIGKLIKRILQQIWLIIDSIKVALIAVAVALLIVFVISLIAHNTLRFGEISVKYTGEYKNLYPVKDKMMNVYVTGEGEESILIMSGFSVASPTLEYKALAEQLAKDYRVIIVEYFGTGFSLSTKDERTNENIVKEVREALNSAEIYGPYILMPFDISNIYAIYYAENYPEEVAGIISVDGMYPKAITKTSFKDDYLPNLISNVRFYSIASFTGIFRWETYLSPEKFNIDKLENNDSYGENEVKLYRRLVANKFLTKEMRGQISMLESNMEDLQDYKYPDNLPVLQILTNDSIKEYNDRNEDMQKYAKNIVSNSSIQKITILDEDIEKYLFEKPSTILNAVRYDYITETIQDNTFDKPNIDGNVSNSTTVMIDTDDESSDQRSDYSNITIGI